MRKKRKIALYNPYLNIFGGGEKHILSILQVFDRAGYKIDVLWNDKSVKDQINTDLNLKFNNLTVIDNFLLNEKISQKTIRTAIYDYFFYISDGSYFFSLAGHNYIFAMVPDRKLYDLTLKNRLKLLNWKFISNSGFTQNKLNALGIKSEYTYPYINTAIDRQIIKKEKIILTVGRFFPYLHNKNHKIIIELFKKFRRKSDLFKGNKLVLAGRCDSKDMAYLRDLKSLVKDDTDISLEVNVSHMRLLDLYRQARFYWHFTGYGIDESKHPEQVEHLGLSPLEAMSGQCLVFCFKAGGIKELVKDGFNGYLFTDENDLYNKMITAMNTNAADLKIRKNASDYIKKNFSYEVFESNVKKFFHI